MKYSIHLLLLLVLFGCKPEANDLPPFPVKFTDGTTVEMNEISGKAVLVLFQPECDHCQREAMRIQENLDRFNDYQVYFISSASIYDNQQFATNYKLDKATNFHFGFASPDHVVQQFGSIPTPSLYVYSDGGKLVNKFIGETPIEKILEVL